MAAIEGDKQEHVKLLCSPCKRKNRIKEADNYCTDCRDYYCSTCVKCHEDIPALSGHVILDKGHFKTGTLETIPVVSTERCESHSFKPVDMYCQNHDDVGCNTCMTVEHRSCKDIFYIPEYVEKDKTATESKEIIRDLKKVEDDIKNQLDIFKEDVKRLLKKKIEECQKVKDFRVEINQELDELERNTIDEIEKKYKALISKIEEDICSLTASRDDASFSQNNISSAGSNMSQLFVSLKRGKTATGKAKCEAKDKASEFSRQEFIFQRNQQLLHNVQQEKYLGTVNQRHALYKLTEKKVYNVKQESDTYTCSIYSACIITDGSLMLGDRNNENLKRLDAVSYKVKDVCALLNHPWQICTAEKEVAVSSGYAKNIHFVTVEGKMKVVREMKTDHHCYGLGYKNDNIYVTDSNTTVYVYNMTGTKLKQISKDQSGQPLFSDIYNLAVSYNGKKIYVTDSSYGLIVLCQDRKLLGKYNWLELKSAREVCEIRDENVLVCGESSNNTIQFAPNGGVVGEVLPSDGGKGGCRAVCYDRRRSILIVGHIDRDEIEIYDVA